MSKKKPTWAGIKSDDLICADSEKKEELFSNKEGPNASPKTTPLNVAKCNSTLPMKPKGRGAASRVKLTAAVKSPIQAHVMTHGVDIGSSLPGIRIQKSKLVQNLNSIKPVIAAKRPAASGTGRVNQKPGTTTFFIEKTTQNVGAREKTTVSVHVSSPKLPRDLSITPIQNRHQASIANCDKSSSETSSCRVLQSSTPPCATCASQGSVKCICKNNMALPVTNSVVTYTAPPLRYVQKNIGTNFITRTVVPKNSTKSIVLPSAIVSSHQPDTFYNSAGRGKVYVISSPRGSPRGGRPKPRARRTAEPIITLSSDDEEQPMEEENSTEASPSSVPNPLSSLRVAQALNAGIARANKIVESLNASKDSEELADEEMPEEDEHMDDEEEESEKTDASSTNSSPRKRGSSDDLHSCRISCRSIRIGSFKIHPVDDTPFVLVFATPSGFSFHVPTVTDVCELVLITVEKSDIEGIQGHFGRCLPVMYIQTNIPCGERIRNLLHMELGIPEYFDPAQTDEKQRYITFLIDHIEESEVRYLRSLFPGDKVLKEIDQKTANEILVKSTPTRTNIPLLCQQAVQQVIPPISTPSVRVSTIPCVPQPVCREREKHTPIKLLTYPPPPQTGGIAITSEDMPCLEEGEFLNDVIIDFYLKYLINEKLSEADRQRTHVFSSFFYPRLTQKPNNRAVKANGDGSKLIKFKRHSHVKTWTKNVDIFEKDFIIIPINQSNHWFLAIICFPAMAAEMPKSPPKVSPVKPAENFSSSINDPDLQANSTPPTPSTPTAKTKDQASSTDDQSQMTENHDEGSLSNEEDSNESDDNSPDLPDSSTHPDKNVFHTKLPCILIFDSLSGPNRNRIMSTLREYLELEWSSKKGSSCEFSKFTMRGDILKVPQQNNFSDCGIYLLQYVESFYENPVPYFGTPMPALIDWFPAEKVTNKRKEIISLILELQKRFSNSVSASAAKKTPKKVLAEKLNDTVANQSLSSPS